ncbi:pantoate--beta-alanine ligase [Caldibacillus debilis]|uniref:pantoate--beta-alanine ligase n=1 Tax=Caldibacillus debilis TaxID=301148 RepID=UPI000376A2FB|nr:pantoate--beta-alanine ligase [Caldibacillus debilis]
MKIVKSVAEMSEIARRLKREGKTVGFVPTMGYLHEGHLALMERARKENDVAVASVFVNPLQFGPNEDYETYPRDFERDKRLAEGAGIGYLFHPDVKEMYPRELSVSVKVVKRTDVLCGRSRPGHFDGVAVVLLKLFSIIQPTRAYFGMKDAQQAAIVGALIEDLNLPVELVPVETVREKDGLAKSSRNVRLTPEEREEAPHLYRSLLLGKSLVEKGEKDPEKIAGAIKDYLTENVSGEIDYVEVLAYPELVPLPEIRGRVILAVAVKFSNARLIDNIVLETAE